MTEVTLKKKKNNKSSTDNRVSTHPSYTEYAWEALVNSDREERNNSDTGNIARTTANPAAARRNNGGAYVNGSYASSKSAVQADTKKKAYAAQASHAERKKSRSATAEKIRKKSIVAMHTVVVEKKYAFPMSIVLIAACFTVLIMAIVTTSVQINEITGENSALQRTYTNLVNEENELRLLLETRDDLRIVETVAKEELGMVKKDQVERYYLTVHKEDRIEIIEEEEDTGNNFFDGVMSFGGSVVERIRGFFGM